MSFLTNANARPRIAMTEQIDDIHMWNAYLNGSQQALSTLAERYYRPLHRYGRRFGVDKTVVDDCIQDLFLELWQNRSRIRVPASVKFYLFKSLRNSVLRYQRYHQRFTSDYELEKNFDKVDLTYAENTLIDKETLDHLVQRLHIQLATLPKREREALYLRYYENLSVSEIADVMSVNRQSVSNFIQKALAKLREHWLGALFVYLSFF